MAETLWSADKLGAVLSAACFERFTERYETTLCSTADGSAETYEVDENAAADDALILVRESDGRRFEIDFFAAATELKPAAASPEGSQ